jgi:ADP-dependent NAD(P)H-hydrate dehydratase / NAD(P)H-hydrate epimerase
MVMKILTAAQMAEVDRLTSERFFIPSMLLMENAGRSFVTELGRFCSGLDKKSILILCGRGNNGGDGFVAARYLSLGGALPTVMLFADPEILKGDAQTNYKIAQAMGIPIQVFSVPSDAESYLNDMAVPDVIVDALFGTGLSKPIGPEFFPILQWIEKASCYACVASVDIPSGLMADSAAVSGEAVKADLTVTFSALKLAHIAPPASDFTGKVVLVPIGSPPVLFENPAYQWNLIDPAQVCRALPERKWDGHKGSYGHIFIVAGSAEKSGAALMAGLGALRSGAGLVTLWLPKGLQNGVVGKFPELMTEFLPETNKGTADQSGAEKVLAQLAQADALVLGPGLTTHESTKRLVWELVRRSPVPVILDADGLNAFVPPEPSLENENGQPVILTPHPGEMARLTGKKISEIQQHRMTIASDYAAKNHCYVILKGFQTVIADPEGNLFLNTTGNPGMATGGTGDILAGMVGRFVASWKLQDFDENRLALTDYLAAAVYLHGLSGDLAAEEGSMESLIATDLVAQFPHAIKKVLNS